MVADDFEMLTPVTSTEGVGVGVAVATGVAVGAAVGVAVATTRPIAEARTG